MNILSESLAKLLPHWAEHAAEHGAEIRQWRIKAEGTVSGRALSHMTEAEAAIKAACEALNAARRALDEK